MTRSTSSPLAPAPLLALGVFAALLATAPVGAQGATQKAGRHAAAAHPATPATSPKADSDSVVATAAQAGVVASDSTDSAMQVTPKPHKSRFGRFGRAIGKAASKAGISRETAARVAITAATGGMGASLIDAKATAASASANALSGGNAAAVPGGNAALLAAAASAAKGKKSGAAQPGAAGAPPLPSLATAPGSEDEVIQAGQFLSTVAMRAAQGDADAVRAMQAIQAAMMPPNGELLALAKRAGTGDVAASRALQLRESQIARAALDHRTP